MRHAPARPLLEFDAEGRVVRRTRLSRWMDAFALPPLVPVPSPRREPVPVSARAWQRTGAALRRAMRGIQG